jgi:ADP-heptose:LPS heptosyltransferase
VINRIQAELRFKVVLAGGSVEEELCARIARLGRVAPVNLTGRIGLTELVALLDGAGMVLSNDSAPLHIAVALGRPVVSIFGTTSAGRTGPYGMPQRVLQADLSCIPCSYRKLSQCPYDQRCMAEITVEQVFRSIADQIDSPSKGPLLSQRSNP